MKWINYHFSNLKDKKWFIILSLIFLLLWGVFFYLGGGFDGRVERLLNSNTYQLEYEQETFMLLNLLMAFFIINMSKDIFELDEPHIMIINKQAYLMTKIITYYLYYVIMIISFYAVYQVMYVLLYGFNPFNYMYIFHLLINALCIHGFSILILGQGKAILKTILLLILFLLLDRLIYLNVSWLIIINFYYPLQTLKSPILGYWHVLLYAVILYILGYYKHHRLFS